MGSIKLMVDNLLPLGRYQRGYLSTNFSPLLWIARASQILLSHSPPPRINKWNKGSPPN